MSARGIDRFLREPRQLLELVRASRRDDRVRATTPLAATRIGAPHLPGVTPRPPRLLVTEHVRGD